MIKNQNLRKFLLAFVFVALLCSCYYDSEEVLFPNIQPPASEIDTTKPAKPISFSGQIQPIINNYCISCHNSSSNPVRLADYNDIKSQADRIYKSITHASGVMPMPQGSARLDDIYITRFRKWMEAGMPNN